MILEIGETGAAIKAGETIEQLVRSGLCVVLTLGDEV